MGFHEQISSPDPYYCRPMGLAEVDVDAITCPTKVFNSAKGKLATDMPMVPYPPRNDLTSLHQQGLRRGRRRQRLPDERRTRSAR